MRTNRYSIPFRRSTGILFFLFISCSLNAQKETTGGMRNAIYFEIGGAGGSHSMNYERVFNLVPKLHAAARGGLGFDNLIDFSDKFNVVVFD